MDDENRNMHQVSDDAAAAAMSTETLVAMLADLCRRVERGYDPGMIARVDGLGAWWAAEKARQKAVDQPTPPQEEALRGRYGRLAADFVNTDPDRF